MTRASAILGPNGQPIVVADLSKEVATPTVAGVRRTHEDRVASGMTPERLGTMLRDASTGNARSYLTLAEEMEERYLHYASQLQTRRLAIGGVKWSIEANKVEQRILDAVEELINDDGFENAAGCLTDAISKGYCLVEMNWEYERKKLRPVSYIERDPRFFHFDPLSLRNLRLAVDGNVEGEPLPEAKFLRHVPITKLGIPIRRGVARPAAWAYLIQQFTLQDWAAFSEVYGMPLRVGKYNAAASAKDKATLLKAVASISNDAAAIIPAGMEIEFHEVNGTNGAAVFGGLLDYIDKQISKLVVGQTMTSDNGSSLGQAKIHNEVRKDILRADCHQLTQTINRDLIRPFIDLNFGPQDVYPEAQLLVPDEEDTVALSDALSKLVPLGLRVKQDEVREKLGLSDPAAEDTDILMPPARPDPVGLPNDPAPPQPKKPVATNPPAGKPDPSRKAALGAIIADHRRSCKCGACTAFLAAEVGISDAIEEIDTLFSAAMEDWQAMADPIVQPIADIIANASSFEEALTMLQAAGPDSRIMAERLQRLTAIARGIGDLAD